MKKSERRSVKEFLVDTIDNIKSSLLKNSPNLVKIVIDVLIIRAVISLVGMSSKKGSYVWDVRIYFLKKLVIGTNLGKDLEKKQ